MKRGIKMNILAIQIYILGSCTRLFTGQDKIIVKEATIHLTFTRWNSSVPCTISATSHHVPPYHVKSRVT